MKTALFASLALVATAAQAQDTVHWALPAAPVTQSAYFPMGTPLKLTNRVELDTKHNRAGERFYLEVAEPLLYRDQVVVPAGSVAVGEIARSKGNGAFGKSGTLGLRLLYVQTPSGPIRLIGQTERNGTGRGLLAIGGGTLIAWPMYFIRGKSGVLPANSVLTAQLVDDLKFRVNAYAAQPPESLMTVAAVGR